MKLAIADPPYPPLLKASGGHKPRGTRWYGTDFRGNNRDSADLHSDVEEWKNPQRHKQLLHDLQQNYDGWAIATAPDALEIYYPLPIGTRICVWVKPNGMPGSHRLRSIWEPIILYIPADLRSNRLFGAIPDVVIANAPRVNFAGAKPPEWTGFILDAFSYNPDLDTIDDLFPGTGLVTEAIRKRVELWRQTHDGAKS